MSDELNNWIKENKIILTISVENNLKTVYVPNFATLLYVKRGGECIISNDFKFILNDDEYNVLKTGKYDYILFEFGGRFYYSQLDLIKNKYGDNAYKPYFNDFKYIGECFDKQQNWFSYLGIHDEYELLNGSGSDELWAKKAKFLGYKTIGLCNKNTQSSTLAFQNACQKYDIKPIFGETVTVAKNYDATLEQLPVTFDLKLYVNNETGYQNLLQINKAINVTYKGFIPDIELYNLGKGLTCVIPKESEFNNIINNKKDCKTLLKKYYESFDDVYYQIDTIEYKSHKLFADHLNILNTYINNYIKYVKPILINDSFYLDKEYGELKGLLNKVSGKVQPESLTQYLKTEKETYEQYKEWPIIENVLTEGMRNADKFADTVNFFIPVGDRRLPRYSDNSDEIFFEEIEKGIQERLIGKVDDIDKYLERIEKECNVIVPAGLSDYFLILWDITRYCRENNIMVGPGRGSVCGSLVAFLLRITDVNPIKHDLLFERFLNETRISGERAKSADSLPDVDIDFPAEYRDTIKKYISEKYGLAYSCSIATFSKMRLRTCIKDFCKVKGLPFAEVNDLTKNIEDQVEYSWGDLIEAAIKSRDLYDFVQKYPYIVHMTKFALDIPKAGSVHPSAVVIVPKKDKNGKEVDIFNWMPIKEIDGMYVSEWEGKYMDKAGFLKEDILGLSQLDKFTNILKLIKNNYGTEITLLDIPLDDLEVYKYFSLGWCEEIFQFGTRGQMQYMREVKPETFEQLAVMTALFRPGPMESGAHHDFALIKNGKKQPEYDYGLKEVTKSTFGLYAYQEGVMAAVNVLGKLSLVEADELRTVMKKKDVTKMQSFKDKFIKGAIENGCPKQEAIEIWDKIDKFSGYGFNKSHAVAYTLMSYWGQWLKVYYPLEFWTTSLTMERETKLPYFIAEMKKFKNNITVSTPDINKSFDEFTCNVKDNAIYSSLTGIKGVGDVAVKHILETRSKGNFFSFEEFCTRVPSKVNKGVIEKLIIAGVFDDIEEIDEPRDRLSLINKLNELKGVKKHKYNDSIFNINATWMRLQKELTGFGDIDFLGLVMDDEKISDRIKKRAIDAHFFHKYGEGDIVGVVGICIRIVEMTVKNGQNKGKKFGRGTLDCNGTMIDFTMWHQDWENNNFTKKSFINKIIFFVGKIQQDTYLNKTALYSDGAKTFVKELKIT
jgi:DNA polymerase-3 subunit alpha